MKHEIIVSFQNFMVIRDMSLRAEGEAISKLNIMILDCFVASLLAMTINWLP